MKVTKIISLVAFVSSLLFCKCDENTNPVDVHSDVESNSTISGTWIMTQMTYQVGTSTYTVMASDSQQLSLTLNSDLTYNQQQISISAGVTVKTEEDGTYSLSESRLTQLPTTGSPTNGEYSLSNTTMILTRTKILQGQTSTTVYQFRRG